MSCLFLFLFGFLGDVAFLEYIVPFTAVVTFSFIESTYYVVRFFHLDDVFYFVTTSWIFYIIQLVM